MMNPTGESESDAVRLDFDRRLTVQFRGSVVTSDAGLLAYRELDDARLDHDGVCCAGRRTDWQESRHALAGLFRQSVFGRLAGYADVNDAERLRSDGCKVELEVWPRMFHVWPMIARILPEARAAIAAIASQVVMISPSA
jgi:hypothetical protein